jgi:putative ABC transport system substrate-binding protein
MAGYFLQVLFQTGEKMLNKSNPHGKSPISWSLFVWVVVIALLLGGCGAQKPKTFHVGILTYGDNFTVTGDGLKEKMTAMGYTEGQNITYDIRKVGTNYDAAEELRLAKELVADKVDVIVAFPSPPVVAAIEATKDTNIPVVFVYYPIEGSKLVKSVREPGGNMTGVRYPGPELMSRRLELLHVLAPQVKRVWVGYDKSGPNTAVALDALRPAAEQAGITLVEVPATKIEELAADLDARAGLEDIGIDAILTMPDNFNTSADGFAVLNKFAIEHKLPLAGGIPSQADQGALFVNGTDTKNLGELAAPIVDKILKGSQAGTLPVVTPDQTLLINYKVAQQLGITVPDGLLKMATKVIR